MTTIHIREILQYPDKDWNWESHSWQVGEYFTWINDPDSGRIYRVHNNRLNYNLIMSFSGQIFGRKVIRPVREGYEYGF